MSLTEFDRLFATRRRVHLPGWCEAWLRRLAVPFAPVIERARGAAAALARGSRAAEPYATVRALVHRRLWTAGIIGFVGMVLIALGASQGNSPFTVPKVAGAWFFGVPASAVSTQPYGVPTPPPGFGLFLGVVAVYGGMGLLIRAWYEVVRTASRHRGIPVARLVPLFIAWMLPLLVVAPLFSRDLYSYVGQGEMMTHHINPYLYGTGDLGSSSIYVTVDPLWQYSTSPYGPVFLVLAGWIVDLAHHDLLAGLIGMRVLAIIGTVLIAIAIPSIARSFNRDGATAFALAALSPLILLHLVGGGHNDALMIGLLAVGYALARKGHPLLGIVCCAVGAVVKVPAIVGVIYIGWEWIGPGHSVRERIRPTATALLLGLAVMAAITEAAGLGWGWISGLSNPDAIRSWLDPATAFGLLGGKIVSAVGLGSLSHAVLTLARGGAFLLAGLIALRLLIRSEEIGSLTALGWTLVAFAALGPVVQPWYLTWGFVFLAPVVEGTARYVLCIGSAAACFLGLPGGFILIHELGVANPILVAVASAALLALLAVLVVPRVRRLLRAPGTTGVFDFQISGDSVSSLATHE